MKYPEKFITELVERNDIVDVVSGYVRLGKKSGSNMFGLCPFHSEKTPSFSVSPDKQIYHCFGCGKGGGVINFIMEIENLSFPEAVEFLARRAGMPLPEQENDAESRKRARMLALNRDAARFFYEQLSTPAGQAARDYMARRRIGPATAKNFGIGFAPDSWDSLRNAMKARGYNDFEMADAGLVRRGKTSGFYDTFRGRLMFPVIDVRGNVIGFSGRILGDGEPKYMNSPETLVFNKSRNLFALNLAKKSKSGYIILAEGNIDVVSLHQAGFDSAVASLGTSLTAEQARLLSRYTKEVIIAYDNDGAGIKAAQRAIGILESQMDYRLRNLLEQYDLGIDEQKVGFLKEATNLVAECSNRMERQVYAMRVAALAGIAQEAVVKEVERRRAQKYRAAQKAAERRQASPEQELQPKERELRYDDPGSAAAEEGVIRLLFMDPALAKRAALPAQEDFSAPALGRIYGILRGKIERGETVSTATLGGELSGEEMSLLVRVLQKPELLSRGEQALADYIRKIQEHKESRREGTDLLQLQKKLKETKGYRG